MRHHLLRRATYLCFGWKHEGFRAGGSKIQRIRWTLHPIHLSLQAFGRHKRLHLFSSLPLKARYLDKDLTYPCLICLAAKLGVGTSDPSRQREVYQIDTHVTRCREKKQLGDWQLHIKMGKLFNSPSRKSPITTPAPQISLITVPICSSRSIQQRKQSMPDKVNSTENKTNSEQNLGVTQMGRGRKRSNPYSRQKEMKIQG